MAPVCSFTISTLRRVAEHEPDVADQAPDVMLPHDWLTLHLAGVGPEATIDRGDASGTGYFSAADDAYRTDLL